LQNLFHFSIICVCRTLHLIPPCTSFVATTGTPQAYFSTFLLSRHQALREQQHVACYNIPHIFCITYKITLSCLSLRISPCIPEPAIVNCTFLDSYLLSEISFLQIHDRFIIRIMFIMTNVQQIFIIFYQFYYVQESSNQYNACRYEQIGFW